MRNRVKVLFGLALALAAGVGIAYWGWLVWLEQSQDGPILAAARRYGVDPALVKAVVWRESHFHPQARGRVGELGLMQIREPAAREWAAAEHLPGFQHARCLDPDTNTLVGAWYLKRVMQRYTRTDNPLPFALADYNAGRANVLKWSAAAGATNSAVFLSQITFPSTRAYIQAVTRRYQRYRPVFPPPTSAP